MSDPLTCSTTLALSGVLLFLNPHLISKAEALPPALLFRLYWDFESGPQRQRQSCFVLVKQMS